MLIASILLALQLQYIAPFAAGEQFLDWLTEKAERVRRALRSCQESQLVVEWSAKLLDTVDKLSYTVFTDLSKLIFSRRKRKKIRFHQILMENLGICLGF